MFGFISNPDTRQRNVFVDCGTKMVDVMMLVLDRDGSNHVIVKKL